MDILSALSQAAGAIKPGARERLPTAAIVFAAFFIASAGPPADPFSFSRAITSVESLDAISASVVVLALVASSILLEPLLALLDGVLMARPTGRLLRPLARRRRERHHDHWRSLEEDLSEVARRFRVLEEERNLRFEALTCPQVVLFISIPKLTQTTHERWPS